MNLNCLFKHQKSLDDRIVKEKQLEGQDLFKKKIVALICELYEMTNEGRWFKFWSDNQTPNVNVWKTEMKHGKPQPVIKNMLLEEYVDVIHFTLSIANDLDYTNHEYIKTQPHDLNDLVIGITNAITVLSASPNHDLMQSIFNNIITLGYQLGFTEKEVIAAYHNKNKVNHERQENGY